MAAFFGGRHFSVCFFFTFLFHPPTQLQTFIPFAKLKLKRKLRTLNFHFIKQHKEILSGAEKSKKKNKLLLSHIYIGLFIFHAQNETGITNT